MESPDKKLEKILANKTSGSSEILIKLNKLLRQNYGNKEFIINAVRLAQRRLSHFSAVSNYINSVSKLYNSKSPRELLKLLNSLEEKLSNRYNLLYLNAQPYIKNTQNILTISNSRTLQIFFERWKIDNKKLKVTVCESRPKLEGRIFAKTLIKGGIKTELITDAAAGFYLPNVDAVITGADSILSNGNVVNKTGSKTLAILCQHYKKPFYVITLKNKFTKSKTFNPRMERPDEIWNFNNGNLNVNNVYFEVVENCLITAVISDKI